MEQNESKKTTSLNVCLFDGLINGGGGGGIYPGGLISGIIFVSTWMGLYPGGFKTGPALMCDFMVWVKHQSDRLAKARPVILWASVFGV